MPGHWWKLGVQRENVIDVTSPWRQADEDNVSTETASQRPPCKDRRKTTVWACCACVFVFCPFLCCVRFGFVSYSCNKHLICSSWNGLHENSWQITLVLMRMCVSTEARWVINTVYYWSRTRERLNHWRCITSLRSCSTVPFKENPYGTKHCLLSCVHQHKQLQTHFSMVSKVKKEAAILKISPFTSALTMFLPTVSPLSAVICLTQQLHHHVDS